MVAERGASQPVLAGVGVALASYGRGVLVQSPGGIVRCGLVGRKLRVVCGDRVAWNVPPSADGPSVQSIEPRRNLIERMDGRGRPEPVAANIDQLAIVVACEPLPDWFIVDRYWAGARFQDLPALLIINKSDLGDEATRDAVREYQTLALPCVEVSARSGVGMLELRERLAGKQTMFVGQSGVGKSSLVNQLAPHAAAQTAVLTRESEGKHTTTAARWHALNADSAIIDAPGVRDFAPPATVARAAELGFVEIHARSGDCRFADCRHLQEPGCAVRAAVTAGSVAARRYESYRRLLRLYEKLR